MQLKDPTDRIAGTTSWMLLASAFAEISAIAGSLERFTHSAIAAWSMRQCIYEKVVTSLHELGFTGDTECRR